MSLGNNNFWNMPLVKPMYMNIQAYNPYTNPKNTSNNIPAKKPAINPFLRPDKKPMDANTISIRLGVIPAIVKRENNVD